MSPARRRRTACGTCIRRKVKCDETHPTCNRCRKGKFVCEGYEPKIVFVEEHPAGSDTEMSVDSAASTPSADGSSSSSSDHSEKSPGPPQSLDLSAWQANVSVAFTMENLFKQKQQGVHRNSGRSWLEIAITSAKHGISMDSAVGALCMAYFGKRHHQLDLVTQSHVRYGRALRTLNQNLGNAETAQSLDTLRDTMALIVYEVIVLTDTRNWMRHADGISKLFQLRGPKAFQDPLSIHIFLSIRMIIVLQCLANRTRCFLAEPEWLNLPSTLTLKSQSLYEQIQDLLCFLPGLVAEMEEMGHATSDQEEMGIKMQSLMARVQTALSALFYWRYRWQAKNPWSAYSVPVDPSRSSANSPFKSVIHFDSLENADSIVLYGGAFITLYEIGEALVGKGNFQFDLALQDAWEKCFDFLPENADQVPLLTLPHASLNPEMVALELCVMADYHLTESIRGLGAFRVIWPLKLSEHVLADKPHVLRWIRDMLDRIAGEDAIEVGKSPLSAFERRD